MAFVRGRYGVEYQPRHDGETHRLRWLLPCLIGLALVSFISARIMIKRRTPRPAPDIEAPTVPPVPDNGGELHEDPPKTAVVAEKPEKKTPVVPAPPAAAPEQPKVERPRPKPAPTPVPEAARTVEGWLETARTRPAGERVLLEKLAAAERQGDMRAAIDTIEKLHDRPTMADLKDKLVRRLGDLNVKYLFTGRTTPWTAPVTVRRGDSRDRIARDHRTTGAALDKLNPKQDWSKIKPGDVVRVIDYPSAVLVIHKQLNYADLSLKNGKFFRRYFITAAKSAQAGVYPVAAEAGQTLRARFRELGIRLTSEDRAELDMFMAPGSRITVADQ